MIRTGAQPRAPLFGGFLLAARDWPLVRTRVRLRTYRRSRDHSSVRAESVVAFALFGDGQPRKRSRTPTLEEHPARDFVPDPDRGRAPVPASRRTAAPPSVAGIVSLDSSCARDSRGDPAEPTRGPCARGREASAPRGATQRAVGNLVSQCLPRTQRHRVDLPALPLAAREAEIEVGERRGLERSVRDGGHLP